MVAKISSGQSVRGALNYNELKVMEGKASCVQANLFSKELDRLTFHDKLRRFEDLNARNLRAKTNTLHISLNFDVGEKVPVDVLVQIASSYMEAIGFGDQPYLAYEHYDAAHPHVHILTTMIQESGKRIPIHNLGRNQSEKARKEIEAIFGLVQAQSKSKEHRVTIDPAEVTKIIYGKAETRRGISNVVRMVTKAYKYTTIAELNAVLRQYNIQANRGTERSQMFLKRGLQYTILDNQGNPIGIPVKASAIYGKPTLAYLEKQFKLNEILRAPFKELLKRKVDQALASPKVNTLAELSTALANHQVIATFRTAADGRTHGVTFTDHEHRSVFKGSDLGKSYSAAFIQQTLFNKSSPSPSTRREAPEKQLPTESQQNTGPSLLLNLIEAEISPNTSIKAALGLRRKKKGRKR